jgi:hypothetical protein
VSFGGTRARFPLYRDAIGSRGRQHHDEGTRDRAYAGTGVDLAKKATSDKDKKHLLAMAEAWLGLADRVQRPVPEPAASSVHPALRSKFGW